ENENKTIRPRGLIESLAHHDGPWGVYQDYYRQGELATYTFSNTFPGGLTSDMYAMIASDIILNANDSRAMFELKIHAYQALLNLKPVKTADEHFGIALTLIYDLLTDEEYFGNIEEALRFISEGRIDSLIFYYDWSSFDLQDQISEIRYHIDQYIQSDELTNYVILIKENIDERGPYELGPNSEFSITYLTVSQVIMATEMIEMAIDGMSMIAEGITGIFDELSQMFDLDLNPELLNFSNVESELDIILILEQSNPNFLTVTPYGIDKFHEMGDWFEEAFEKMATFYDNMVDLMNAMEPYQDEFEINASEMASIMEMFRDINREIYTDFAEPDSTTWIEGERVNLSAWFDNPPTSFLQMWKKYVIGVDSTLGGLFPDRYKQTGIAELPILPKQFKMYPVYPNPFNPTARIEFDLPAAAEVKLTVINLNGEVVAELIKGHYQAGKIITAWDAAAFPSGVYFSRLSIDGKITTRKMTLMK
ncbi:MAG: T9SS type A sorting domain-containing protein, partial [Candidatus Marinimicrobia bacterium]|nr:T9SS type A sorting domain-containing protein [Candidatus Neomarinimicrobiota bacterium]